MNARSKYHSLLAEGQAAELSRIVAECSRQICVVTSASQAAELSGALGLPLELSPTTNAMGPTPPFNAPFSEMVPRMLYLVRK